ncbi:MAG: type II toxin-antitoxin system HicB family antitoxin [Gracilibacteraceae bacterium]|nr:type II toxin-antitoxin system HicB family antitoxin [Gracilibacteraceae bacterium]
MKVTLKKSAAKYLAKCPKRDYDKLAIALAGLERLDKLSLLPTVEPDALDLALLAEADAESDPKDDGTPLENVIAAREYNGKILLRVPKDLHAELTATAKSQGVSLNQYCLYKLAR